MKFISVADGISIKKSEIIMVERVEAGGCRVTTVNNSIQSIFPYETILSLLENDAIEETVKDRATFEPKQFWRL